MRIVVTGASGLVGQEFVAGLAQSGDHQIAVAVRKPLARLPSTCEQLVITDLADDTACGQIAARAKDGGTLVHLAALTPGAGHSDAEFEDVNANGTQNLMRAAVAAGVGHFIYLSSTHTCGALSRGSPIDEDSPVTAQGDAYGASKLAGETAVRTLARDSETKWTIVRCPLVYGPGAKGSLALLARAVQRGLPLPLSRVTANARDMIGVTNLAAFLELCATNPRALNETFVVRDGEAVSTRQLVDDVATAAGQRPRLLPLPVKLLQMSARAIGAGQMADRLVGDHQVNDAKARRLLGWRAPHPRAFDIERMVQALKSKRPTEQ